MSVQPQNFVEDFKVFMKDSLAWCKSESETESSSILLTLQGVMEDVKRRSKMSASAESSLINAQSKLSEIVSNAEGVALDELLGELRTLKSDSAEVNRLVNPVIEALQFQDRLVQNLQNIEKIINLWFEFEKNTQGKDDSTQEMNFLAEQLVKQILKATTTADERNLVRARFEIKDSEAKIVRSA